MPLYSLLMLEKNLQLIKLIIEIDDSSLTGKSMSTEGLDAYQNKLARSSIIMTSKKYTLEMQ